MTTEPQKPEPTSTPTPQPKAKPIKENWKQKFLDLEAKVKAQNPPNQPSLVQSPNSEPSPPNHDHSHSEGQPHYIGAWQQYCPTCGDKNPEFKDEVECADCHTHLGAKELAVKLKACPNCGGTHAREIKK